MNIQMWQQPIVQENTHKLLKYGWHQIGPEQGSLACGTTGFGRMSGPHAITQIILHSIF
jgi:phosphopantothenoylcysteine decarboxylase/phosphopantothenate--cysteine ligase